MPRNTFSSVSALRPKRSLFDLSYEKKFSADFSYLYPVLCDECVPGDVWKIGNSAVVRFNPLVAPVMHEINATVHYFFVPYRIIDPDFETNITGGRDGNQFINGFPCWPTLPGSGSILGTLWDYFGFPTDLGAGQIATFNAQGFYPSTDGFIKPLDYPRRAYGCIFSQYYLDQNLVANSDLFIDVDGSFKLSSYTSILSDANMLTLMSLQQRSWTKDYFTSALPWQQRGQVGALPISAGFVGSTVFDGNILAYNNTSGTAVFPPNGPSNYISVLTTDNSSSPNLRSMLESGLSGFDPVPGATTFKNWFNNNHIDGSITASSFTVSDMRTLFQIQKWLERNARSGVRYTEFLRAHFSVAPRDERLQRPEYIGGTKSPVIISEVLQTGSTNTTSPQANMAGHGISVAGNYVGSYHVQEYGLIMGLLSIMPKPAYEDRMDRQWIKKTKYDFYFPEFAHLSEQGIYRAELRYIGQSFFDSIIFGFQGRYDEMRFKHDQICGLFRQSAPTNLSYWHCGRHFDYSGGGPNLTQAFLTGGFNESTGAKRILAVPAEPAFLVNFRNNITAIRPLPVYSDPGLLDHF